MNQNSKTILFDLDGTLIDPKEGITKCIQFALEKMGKLVPTADALEWCIGPPLRDSFANLLNSSCENELNIALKFYRERYTKLGMFEHHIYEGVEWMLQRFCEDGIRLFIATSKPKIFAVKILQYFCLDSYFEKIYGAELDGTRSDKSELLQHILAENTLGNAIWMVGDRKFDAIAARQNEIFPIGVTYGYGSKNELAEAGVIRFCDSPKEVYRLIQS